MRGIAMQNIFNMFVLYRLTNDLGPGPGKTRVILAHYSLGSVFLQENKGFYRVFQLTVKTPVPRLRIGASGTRGPWVDPGSGV